MHMLFVCTGNVSRSAMAEMLAPHFFADASLTFASAGTRGLHDHAMSSDAADLMRRDHIDETTIEAFRSRRITPQIAKDADLILCFEERQRGDIVVESPLAARRTFLITDFTNLCEAAKREGWIEGGTFAERIDSIIANAGLLRPQLPEPEDVADPQGLGMDAFVEAHNTIVRLFKRLAAALE